MHGKGIMKFALGDKYDGNWRDGFKDGKGTYWYPNGNRYDGNWKNNKKDGKGFTDAFLF